MERKIKRIDLLEIMLDGTKVKIQHADTTFKIHYRDKVHSIKLEAINEIGMYKMDHMTHDTIMLYFNTDEIVVEIPFEISIHHGELSKNHYLIEKYSWSCSIPNWMDFIDWLSESLSGFDQKWLNTTDQLHDSPSLVINYKKHPYL